MNELCKSLQRSTYFVLSYYGFYLWERKREQLTGTGASGGVLWEMRARLLRARSSGLRSRSSGRTRERVNGERGFIALTTPTENRCP